MAGISIEGVRKSFGGAAILHDISLDLAQGEFLSLVGPSGCGKTTLLRIIAGLEQADAGRVSIGGQDVTRLRPADRDVAMVFQNYALYPHLTVAQNMAVPLAMRRLSVLGRLPLLRHLSPGQAAARRGIMDDVRQAADMLAIGHLLDRRPGQLSGGQRQRVALGRAVVRHPAAFLMDEPLSNLDAELRARTRKEIVQLHRRAGVTTVYVTHDQVEAMTMSDRVALMQAGRILQIGKPRTMYDDPASLAVAQFLGSPRINTLPGTVDEGRVVVEGLRLPVHPAAADGTGVTVGLRPETLRLTPAGPLFAAVEHLESLGADSLLHTRCGATPLVARVPAAAADGLRPGEAVRFEADWPAALLFTAEGARLAHARAMAHV
ncbi:MAG: glycerol-3-phosphate ABC transporter ATP-binding protein [Acetobacteraceae bacterium SCN 69-10]|nr:ABC transporter ATP-binding protein [Rhodospirillales bacterium]ODU59512.1 MAG: glycerol-3-phosphate ABC transporter ATP-binding protein [Acetobacteraceae bacterium SCN 69-10]OJY73109.1 MAG: glycerol-3-phosphate ABC transporter ATP-binding protein [Rhodospirillales bacterium 70-18]